MRCYPLLVIGIMLIQTTLAVPQQPPPSPNSPSLFFDRDGRQQITDTSLPPWQAIGQLRTAKGRVCTASLITPQLAITSGHCLLLPTGKIDYPLHIRFIARQQHQVYQDVNALAVIDPSLLAQLPPWQGQWTIPPAALAHDFAILLLSKPLNDIVPLRLFDGDVAQLLTALQAQQMRVTLAGYPADHPDQLWVHTDCLSTQLTRAGTLAHRCNSLPGNSGSPLLILHRNQWQLIAIQSSAPLAKERHVADNQAVTIPAILQRIKQLSLN